MTAAARTYALMSGGGTGGHVYPALAVADELVARGHPRGAIGFVGARRGPESTAVPAAGYHIDLLPGRGLQRSLSLRATAANLEAAGGNAVAFARAAALVGRVRPAVVVGVGGYASLPAVVAARAFGIPVVVHESDAHPGLANRVAVGLGARAAVSLPGTPLRGAVVTGNPIRPALAAVRRAPSTPPLVAVVGGSLGARRINDAVLSLARDWRARDDVVIHHVTGARDYERCVQERDAARRAGDVLDYRMVPYQEQMEELYAHASVMVCRSGGMTAELAAVGMPALLVPLPGAPGDHQTRNAEAFAEAGGAVLVPDGELDGERLAAALDRVLGAPDRLASMSTAVRSLARPDAAARVADLVEEAARARG